MRAEDGQTRRQWLRVAFGTAAGVALGAPSVRAAAAGRLQDVGRQAAAVTPLADDLFVVALPGGTNVVAYAGGEGLVLVDGAPPAEHEVLMRAVTGLPGGKPVRTLFNTHWHPEQTGSNAALARAGCATVAHENTRLWLTTDVTWPWNGRTHRRLSKDAQPTQTFYTTGQLSPGVRYGHIPDAAHTDGDAYVHFPDRNVIAVGDAVSGQGWPVVDWATGGWIGGIVGGLQRVQALADAQTRIVPGRGPVLGLADIKTQYDMYGTIYDRLTQLLNKGRGPTEAVEARPTKEFDAQMGNPDEFVRRAFESLWGYLSPDA